MNGELLARRYLVFIGAYLFKCHYKQMLEFSTDYVLETFLLISNSNSFLTVWLSKFL